MPKENRKIAKTATEALKILWEEGVFSKWMKIAAVVEELSKKEYHFPLTNVNKTSIFSRPPVSRLIPLHP